MKKWGSPVKGMVPEAKKWCIDIAVAILKHTITSHIEKHVPETHHSTHSEFRLGSSLKKHSFLLRDKSRRPPV